MQKVSKTMATKFEAKGKKFESGFQAQEGVVESFEIRNAKQFDWGTTFTLVLNGVEIHNCKVGERKDGNSFISFPSYKGKDGKYYSYVYFRFSEADSDAILQALAEQLA